MRYTLQAAGLFLSTPSARRATVSVDRDRISLTISIHALRKEGDHLATLQWISVQQFLSTPSARRATDCATD